jgi:predicted component of type VI protein secretion system
VTELTINTENVIGCGDTTTFDFNSLNDFTPNALFKQGSALYKLKQSHEAIVNLLQQLQSNESFAAAFKAIGKDSESKAELIRWANSDTNFDEIILELKRNKNYE